MANYTFEIRKHRVSVSAKNIGAAFTRACRQLIRAGLIKNRPHWDKDDVWWEDTQLIGLSPTLKVSRIPEPVRLPDYVMRHKTPSDQDQLPPGKGNRTRPMVFLPSSNSQSFRRRSLAGVA